MGSKTETKKKLVKSYLLTFTFINFTNLISYCSAHGRMENPPSRNAAWRHGFNTPVNYNDVELNCGGIGIQNYLAGLFFLFILFLLVSLIFLNSRRFMWNMW